MVPSLDGLTVRVWQWCLDHHCLIEASYLPERENNSADFSSWEPCSRLDWKLHPDVFSRITEVLFMPDTDLFATRFNTQLKQFVSWKPDPDAWFYNAFSRPWSGLVPYVFPPFSLLGRILTTIQEAQVQKAIVIALFWSTSHWYSTLLSTLFIRPRLLPRRPDLLMLNRIELHHRKDSIILAAWSVPGNNFLTQAFINSQPTLSSTLGAQEHKSSTVLRANNTVVGVVRNKSTPFEQL